MTPDPIAAWHGLLDDGQVRESAEWLAERQRARGAAFGDRPVCTVLRPRFLSVGQYDSLRRSCESLLGALRTAGDAAIADRSFRAAFRLNDWEETLIERFPRPPEVCTLSRIDAFLDPGSGIARLTEFNGETPAGSGYVDFLTELFQLLPVMRQFSRDWVVRPLPAVPHLLGALLDTWAAARGHGNAPGIAIVDWDDVPTMSEFRLIESAAHALGLQFRVTSPEALSYQGGKLRDADGTVIDLVYKRVLLHELVEESGVDHPLLAAAAAGDALMVNGPHCKPLHKKASLAVLTDERHSDRFSPAEHAAIDLHVPWTRVVEERHTLLDGQRIDLLPWMADHREQLVLKPNDDYGGAGIVLGWEVDDAKWSAAVRRATEQPYIVQRRIALPSEPFAAVVDGQVVIDDRIVDIAPYCWHGSRMDGVLTRISTSTLVNVTAGGGSTVPTFVVEPR
ncbi:MAG TPA: hypothetical protein PLL69_01350 [Gemmatimonadales bacterium]|nr:hypothetical protein [Gemmatimonadales bacterium]